MSDKAKRIAGWVLSGVLAFFMIVPSAGGKFAQWEGKEKMFEHLGYSIATIQKIGVVEIVVSVLFLIPRTAFFGAVLLTAYLGGVVATHVRIQDPFVIPVVLGVLVWVGLVLRRPDLMAPILGQRA